jgi:hypothetical protein
MPDSELQESDSLTRQESWQVLVTAALGVYWGLNFSVSLLVEGGKPAPVEWLPLIGFFAPALCFSRRRLWWRLAFWICLVEASVSPLLWVGSFVQFMDPIGARTRVCGLPFFMIWSIGGQFICFCARALLFGTVALLIHRAPENPATQKL